MIFFFWIDEVIHIMASYLNGFFVWKVMYKLKRKSNKKNWENLGNIFLGKKEGESDV